MPRRLPPLSTLKAFEATARLGSVTRAADELGRTHGAISRQIRALQDHAGLPLFEKAGTGLRLNPQGETLLQVVGHALDQLEQGWQQVLDEARGPSVHVACSATFAMRWLVPHLPGFYRRHPQVRVRLSMTSARDIRHQGADLVLAWDRLSYPERDQARAIRIADVAFGPVCASRYPAAVKRKRLTCPARITHEHTSRAWTVWQDNSGLQVTHKKELSFPHTHLCIEAALSGLGVALVERRMVVDDLAAGRLVAPCGFISFADGLAVVPASERASSPAARAFMAWIADELSEQGRRP
ncbi:LysR substrate-binding domain-containing protein [Bradyrhizobium prioriisuperbiae]|uniref:LysR substrate-binding domain-containing protein n=1 Tax=Bradyrhizobium prioriisuperbiae TaxID=2854389 RepID=UPI0028E8DE1A|nr:LysR substrate-binding domain-containing protein [Bradyrhizobium prioritasuperba]